MRPLPEGQLPWRTDDRILYDAQDAEIGMMDSEQMAKLVVDCVNYIWETRPR